MRAPSAPTGSRPLARAADGHQPPLHEHAEPLPQPCEAPELPTPTH